MSNEPVFVAIGIACVVAVLLFIIFIIYCVKKQQDKEQTRLLRQRRAREERHRRHLMGANIVHPPPYDPNRPNLAPYTEPRVPHSPPPEYKEIATPFPRNRSSPHGLENTLNTSPFEGSLSNPDDVPSITRNVAPANTVLAGNSYLNYGPAVPVSGAAYSGGRYVNRTTITTTISNHIHDTFREGQLSSGAAVSDRTARSASGVVISDGLSHAGINWQKPNAFSRHIEQLYAQNASPRELLDKPALIGQQDSGLLIRTADLSNRGGTSFYDSSYPSQVTRQPPNSTHHQTRQPPSPTNHQRSDSIPITNTTGLHRDDRHTFSSYRLAAGDGGASTGPYMTAISREVVPVQHSTSNNHQIVGNLSQPTSSQTGQRGKDFNSGFEELSLI